MWSGPHRVVEEEGISAEVQSEEEEREFLKEEILGLQWIRITFSAVGC